MKATFDLPEHLYRRVKSRSAKEGRPVRAVLVELLSGWLNNDLSPRPLTTEHDSPPAWFGMAKSKVTQQDDHSMESIRKSIATGRSK